MCSYELTVVARDQADEPRSSNATIFVTVRDENDNPPVIVNITSGVTMVQVEEVTLYPLPFNQYVINFYTQDTDIGTLIFNVHATDDDDGSNGEISYSFDDLSLPFDISPSGGAITVAGSLDYETRNEYTVRLLYISQCS